MNRRTSITAAVLALAILVILILERNAKVNPGKDAKNLPQSTEFGSVSESNVIEQADKSPSSSVGQDNPKTEHLLHPKTETLSGMIENEVALWQGPLIYFGKVMDENDRPIAGAQAAYGANSMDQLRKEVYNTGTVTTDERGIFKVDGVRGVNLMVQVSHPDYYAYPTNSTGFDKRSVPKKGYFSDSEENAEIFRMHRKGNPVPLVHRRGGADVPVNTGNAVVKFYGTEDKQAIGRLQIEAWGNTPKNFSRTPYDWSVRLTLADDGGLTELTNQFDFVAPERGYKNPVEISMSKDKEGWSDTVDSWYFVKLSGGYARMRIHVRAKTPLYVSLEYYFNPDGSKNLESLK